MGIRELLAPWLPVLRQETELVEDPTEDEIYDARSSGTLWISWRSRRVRRGQATAVFPYEALELLALGAALDYEAWLGIISGLWALTAPLWVRIFGEQRFKLGVELDSLEAVTLSRWCGPFLVGDAELFATDQYKHTRQRLEEMASTQVLEDQAVSVPVRVRLRAPFPTTPRDGEQEIRFDESCLELVKLASLQATLRHRRADAVCGGRRWSPLLRLTEMTFETTAKAWSTKAFAHFGQISALGVQVHPVELHSICAITSATASAIVPTLHRVLGVAQHDNGLGTVWVTVHDDVQSVDAIFSALLMSKSVREVGISIKRACIALVAFSGYAVNRIKKIVFDGSSFHVDNVQTVEQLLLAPDPLSLLFPFSSRVEESSSQFVVTASKFCLRANELGSPGWSEDDSQSSTLVFDTPLEDLTVLEGTELNSDWYSVLLPGWGRAWVATADARVTEKLRRRDDVLKVRPNRQLVLQSAQDSQGAAIAEFLRVLAMNVQTLRFQACTLSDISMRSIFSACPRLEEAEVSQMTLDRIASVYEDGVCRASRLLLLLQDIPDEDATNHFFDHLADRRHALAKCLRVLHFSYESRGLLEGFHTSVLQMLQQNQLLYELHLTVGFREDAGINTEEELQVIQAECNGYDGGAIVVPLDLTKKVAFLSVVHSSSLASPGNSTLRAPQTVQLLDSSVLGTIFEFAAHRHTRLVHVRYYSYQL